MTAFNDILGLEGSARMNPGGVFMATAIASCPGYIINGFLGKLSFCIGSRYGIKCIFCLYGSVGHGYSWKVTLATVCY